MKRILVLFPKEWDRLEFARPEYARDFEFVYAGFDLFRFPDNVRLLGFDVFRFVNEVVARFRRERLDGVFSNNEYFGTLIAAVVAEKLGLPGNDPRVALTAQHKFYARRAFAAIAPEASPRFAAFAYTVRRREEFPFDLPCFVKPVKATYSVLARRIDTFDELRRHVGFWPLEKYSSASRTSVLCKCRTSVANFSIEAAMIARVLKYSACRSRWMIWVETEAGWSPSFLQT